MTLALISNTAPDSADAIVPLSGEVFGALINLSGRRRFTSQRLVLYAVLAAQGQEDAVATASEALGLFRNAHKLLLKGGDGLPGVFCAELQRATSAPARRAADRRLHRPAERTLHAIGSGGIAPGLLAELIGVTTPTLPCSTRSPSTRSSPLHARLMRAARHHHRDRNHCQAYKMVVSTPRGSGPPPRRPRVRRRRRRDGQHHQRDGQHGQRALSAAA